MDITSLIGLIILIVGIFFIGVGIRSSRTFTNRVVGGITGHYTRRTTWYLISGILLILIGGALLFFWSPGTIVPHP